MRSMYHGTNLARLVVVIVERVDYARAHLRMMTKIFGSQISTKNTNSDVLEKLRKSEILWKYSIL